MFEVADVVLNSLGLRLGLQSLLFELANFFTQRANTIQDVRVVDLSLYPLHQGGTGFASTADSFVSELAIAQIFTLHLESVAFCHLFLIVIIDDAGNEIISSHD